MTDYHDLNSASPIADELKEKANQYAQARENYATAVYNLNIMLAAKMPELRKRKSNLGHETALLMLLEENDQEVRGYYYEMLTKEARFKSIEKIIDALNSQLILVQSIAKTTKGATHVGI